MKCQTCGNDNAEDAQFCGVCATSLISGEASAGTELTMVGFGEAVKQGFKNYFTFSGNPTRAEYWWWMQFITLTSMILRGVPVGITQSVIREIVVQNLFGLATLVLSLALGARRLHDIGESGLWLLGIIPL